jgi:UTP--glucose-1-phosphate uridylyltransferase
VVNECIAAGITEIVLVTHSSKNSIENHFDTSFELEAMLEKRVKRQLLEEVQSICPPHVTIMQVRQGLAKGLGHAVLCAHPVVGNEPVAVILPDVILDEFESDLSQDNLAEMIKRFDDTGSSQIMVEPVADVTAYGVVDCKGIELKPGESVPMVGVVEKPKADVAPSNLAVVGRYVLSAEIWPLLAKTPPGAGDEIQLTDAIDMLIEKETVEAYHMKGKSHDCGNKLGYIFILNDTDGHWAAVSELIAPQGHICTIVENAQPLDQNKLKSKSAALHWEFMYTRSMYQTADMARQGEILNTVAKLVDEGVVESSLSETLHGLSVESITEAHRKVLEGHMRGKVVVEF